MQLNEAAFSDHGNTKLDHHHQLSYNYLNTHIDHKTAWRVIKLLHISYSYFSKNNTKKYCNWKQISLEFKCQTLWRREWRSGVLVQSKSITDRNQIKNQVQYCALPGNDIVLKYSNSIIYLWMIHQLLITVVPSFPITITCNYFSITAPLGRRDGWNNGPWKSHFIHFLASKETQYGNPNNNFNSTWINILEKWRDCKRHRFIH